MPEKFFLTTPIYYVNARPHIGHAYTTIVADVLARRSRAQGIDTFFLTGTDEHGQKIERSAAAAGIPPQQFADQVSAEFRTLWDRMGLTYDRYIRTTDEAHKRGAQKLFADLHARGQIYLSSYTGQYSIGEEMFVEGPPGTIGPDGKPTETVTEENFFFKLSEYQLPLLNLIESDTLKITPEARKNEVLSFLRGSIASVLEKFMETSGREGIAGAFSPEDVQAALDSGDLPKTAAGFPYVPGALKDLSVSRSSFTWGIPVPDPAASEAKEKHVIYVWLDALANYMTALGYGSDDDSLWQKYWPADLHLVGKEIIRFHCVYWPAFLMAAGLPLPKAVTAHGWLLFEDSKMSKSKGNIVRTETILDAFGTLCPAPHPSPPQAVILSEAKNPRISPEAPLGPTPHDRDLFASDVLRYFLLREIPFGQDGSFSFDALVTRYNADLANGYGNLVSRTLKLISTSSHHAIAPSDPFDTQHWETNEIERSWDEIAYGENWKKLASAPSSESTTMWDVKIGAKQCMLMCSFEEAISLTVSTTTLAAQVQVTDAFLSDKAPWKLAKVGTVDAQHEVEKVLYTAAESIRIITALLYPILPYATANVWRQLGLGDIEAAAKNGELKNLQWGGLKPGTKLGPLSPIFPRADKGLAQTMSDMETEKNLTHVTAQADAATSTKTEFKEASLASESGAPGLTSETWDSTAPAAGPRTSTFTETNPGAQVAASDASTTERTGTPAHTEAASGIFAQAANKSGAPFIPESHPGISGSASKNPASETPASEAPTYEPEAPGGSSPQITIDDFAKIELRVAKILVAERIPKADKLLRLEVDLGYEKRQILSGIAEFYTPEELVGRRIVVITNLAPRRMRGLESHGMLLAASATEGGKPALATFADTDDIPLGSRLK